MLEGYVLALRGAVSSEPAAWRAGLGPPYVDPPSRQLRVTRLFSDEQRGESNFDHLIFVCLYRIAPGILDAVTIVQPETIIRWHRAGFRSFWRWKSRQRVGRPNVSLEVRRLIREMSLANPLWGAPRIHAELLKLGINIGQTLRCQVHGAAKATSLARLENVPAESRRRDRLDRPICGSDDLISAALWITRAGPRPETHPLAWRHRTS